MKAPGLVEALEDAARRLGVEDGVPVQVERPGNVEHGDLATNLAMLLAGRLDRPPRQIAEDLLGELDLADLGMESAEIAGPGFINFRLSRRTLYERLREVIRRDDAYGRSEWGRGTSVIVEFVSANPTGPLHVGHGRGAAVGDSIARLLEWTGHTVHREFYVNDAGAQIEKLVESVRARLAQLGGRDVPVPEGGYRGAYVTELARSLLEAHPERLDDGGASDQARSLIRDEVLHAIQTEQTADLRALDIEFDAFHQETALYESGAIETALELLRERGLVYEREDALWLSTMRFGDDKDRVLVKSDGTYTYFLPDIAYHWNKAARGFGIAIDIWGADHHGYVARMRAAMEALDLGSDFLEAVIIQLVRVQRGGEEVRFSKRAGEFVTLRDLVDEVGSDVTRYFFLERRPSQQMIFDLDLALERSETNPVYKTQYAHARLRSIYRKGGIDPRGIDPDVDLEALDRPEETEMIKTLLDFPEIVDGAARAREPHRVASYLEGLANQLNSWYHAGNRDPRLRVLGVERPIRQARLVLARGAEIVLRNGLTLLGVEAPDAM